MKKIRDEKMLYWRFYSFLTQHVLMYLFIGLFGHIDLF